MVWFVDVLMDVSCRAAVVRKAIQYDGVEFGEWRVGCYVSETAVLEFMLQWGNDMPLL